MFTQFFMTYPSIVFLIVALAIFWVLAVYQVNNKVWVGFLFSAVISSQYLFITKVTIYCMIAAWSVVIIFSTLALSGFIRKKLLVKPIYNWFKKLMPPMSATEVEAIEAGDTWVDADLFSARLNWDDFLATKTCKLTKNEQDFMDNQVNTLCAMLDDWQITHIDKDLPKAVWDYLKKEKFFSLQIPKDYGGLDFSAFANSCIVMKICSKSLSAAVTVMVPNSLGPGELLIKYGTDAQKNHWLPRLADGREIPCFGLTGIEVGSDAGAMPDIGIVTTKRIKGRETLGVSLSWNKRYITLAPIASLIGLAVKLEDPNKLLGSDTQLGITLFLLPRDTKGVQIGRRHFPLNQAFMNGPTSGSNVFVPMDYIIGGEQMIGKGWRMLVECLAAGRGISLPALAAAVGQTCHRTSGAYALVRKQFNMSIGKFEGVSEALGRIGGLNYILESSRMLTLTGLDAGLKPGVVTAIAKASMTNMARQIINDSMDVHAGKAIMLGPNNYLARAYEGIPISVTVEGANILTRSLIIFGQGVMRCHPYVRGEVVAAYDDDLQRGLDAFDEHLFKHISYVVANFAKLKFHSLTCMRFCATPSNIDKKLRTYCRRVSFYSIALACVTDISLLIVGGNLKRKEYLSARLGDVLSNLYMAIGIIKYYQENSKEPQELAYATWALDYCMYAIYEAFTDYLYNFKPKFIGCILKFLIFPFGRKQHKPKDSLFSSIAKDMMSNSSLRTRLTNLTSFNLGKDSIGILEAAMLKMLEVQPLLSQIEKAQKLGKIAPGALSAAKLEDCVANNIITDAQAGELALFEKLRLAVINVDDFKEL